MAKPSKKTPTPMPDNKAIEAAEAAPKNHSGGTVTVACKVPGGLRLRVFEMVDSLETIPGIGQRTAKMAQPVGGQVVINGPAHPINRAPGKEIAGGYALTMGVPADFFRAWMQQNKDSAMVRNRLIFAHENADYARSKAREQEEIRTGIEGINQDGDARLRGVTLADERRKAA